MGGQQRPSAPKPWGQRETRTTYVRVPLDDWASVKRGSKTEFRASGHFTTQLWNVQCPTPVVGWTIRRVGGPEACMLILEQTWSEPLAAISAESLEREGYPDMAHFRRYWMERTNRRFRPLQQVQVFRVRPLLEEDHVKMGLELLRKLYGEHL